jgi:hypothetical protein
VHFYIRDEYKQVHELFCQIIKKDRSLDALMTSKKIGRLSIAICQLEAKYVKEHASLIKQSKQEPEEVEEAQDV